MNKVEDIVLIVFDTIENFNSSNTTENIGGDDLYKKVECVCSRQEFQNVLSTLDPHQPFVLACHIFYNGMDGNGDRNIGFRNFNKEKIEQRFRIKPIYVSSGDTGEAMKFIFKDFGERKQVFKYDVLYEAIQNNTDGVHIYTPSEILNSDERYDLGIINALYDEEFSKLKAFFTWETSNYKRIGSKTFRVGHSNDARNLKVVAVVPDEMGMIDTAIMATQMIEHFKPKTILMTGVCAGTEKMNYGDIVVAKSVCTFQRGKLSKITNNDGDSYIVKNDNDEKIEFKYLVDQDGNKLTLMNEKFEFEQDTISGHFKDELDENKEYIIEQINREINDNPMTSEKVAFKIFHEKVACSSMVINNKDFFEYRVKKVDRKIAALEMESYGVARACQYASNGQPKWLIVKSVMDKMENKTDDYKSLAAYTSALFIKYAIEKGFFD